MSEWERDGFVVSDDPARVDHDVVYGYLSGESYWAKGRARSVQDTANAASWCFSLFDQGSGAQVGFARLVTDYGTFAWLADVFILPAFQGRRLGHFLVGCVTEAAAEIPRLFLGTRDAHTVYADVGFTPLSHPGRMMERLLVPLPP
jgi:GNAT superfamily N-acetyltransferase